MITREMLAEAMSEIDQDIIEEHMKRISPTRVTASYVTAVLIYAAACAAIILALPFIIGKVNENSVILNPSVSVETEDTVTTEPVEEEKTYNSWDDAMEGEYKEALADLSRLCGYFHEPYSIGDNIMEKRILDICFRHALFYSFDYPSLVINEYETQTVSISEAELDSICKALFGEHVSIRDYDRFLYAYPSDYTAAADQAASSGEWGTIGNSAQYLKDGVYTYTYATDYWGECAYSINYDIPPMIRPMDDGFAVTVDLLYSRDLGESESAGEVTYTFELTTDCSGNDRYRLVNIDSDIHCTNTVQCVVNEAMMGFDPDCSRIPLEGHMFTMSVDESLTSTEGDFKNFMSWNGEEKSYVRALEFVSAYRVDAGYVMDETIHQKAYMGGTQPTFEGVEPIIGTNKNGVDYVMYLVYKSGGFISYTYFRIDYNLIVGFSYGGSDEDKQTVLAWCDSVSPMIQQ